MSGRLDGKVCVITGAGGGMGREAAVLFTAEGARVCVADVSAETAEETVGLCAGEAFAFAVDVADEDGVAAMMRTTAERFGGIDGSAYFIGGFGMTALTANNIVLVPIRSGVGLRLGANIGYLKFTPRPTWNPL